MKKTLTSLLIVALILLIMAMPAFAGGGQVRGDNALGSANQVQVQIHPRFNRSLL